MGGSKHAEAFCMSAQASDSEAESPQFQIEGYGAAFAAALGELTEMAVENGGQLSFQKPSGGFDIAVGLCGHVIGKGFNRRGIHTVCLTELGIRREICGETGRVAHIQMVCVTFACDTGVGGENYIRLEIADNLHHSVQKLFVLIEAAINKVEKSYVLHAESGGRAFCLVPAGMHQFIGAYFFINICVAKSSVSADEKTYILVLFNQFCRCCTGSDLNIIGVRAYKEITLIAFDFRQGYREFYYCFYQ